MGKGTLDGSKLRQTMNASAGQRFSASRHGHSHLRYPADCFEACGPKPLLLVT